MAKRSQTRFGVRDDCCGLWSWGGKPLTDGDTHTARREAHDAFDNLWRDGRMSRGEAYRLLQGALGLTAEDCHMARMPLEQARRVPQAVQQIMQGTDDTTISLWP